MSKGLPLPNNSWTSNLITEQEKEEFQSRLLENKDLFQRLYQMAEIKMKANSSSRTSKSSYDKPAWSEFQADANGYERGLMEILEYLKFTKD